PSWVTIDADTCALNGSSRRELRERSMSRHTRATTVVSHPPRFWMPLASERLNRSQASWTASSASVSEPSIRYATARRWVRFSSKGAASPSRSSMSHPLLAIRHGIDEGSPTDVTRRRMMQPRMKNPAMIVPDAMQALLALGASAEEGGVPPRTLGLVHLRASQINGCSLCVDMHPRMLKKTGETDE